MGARREVVRGPGAVRAGTAPTPAARSRAGSLRGRGGDGSWAPERAGVAEGASRVAGSALEQSPPGRSRPRSGPSELSEVTWTPAASGALKRIG